MTKNLYCRFRRLSTTRIGRGVALILVASTALAAGSGRVVATAAAQTPKRTSGAAGARAGVGAPLPERAIRRDLPLTDMIRRAFAAGTRDSSGRPGRNYWQLRTEYTIDAKLDPATATLTGRERVVIHNPSDSVMRDVVLRLDPNLYAAGAARASAVASQDVSNGIMMTRLAIDGRAIDLTDLPTARQLQGTAARIVLPAPILGRGRATLEAEWSFRVPNNGRLGHWGDSLFQVAQWYPRVAVFDDLRHGGWDMEPYLGPAEFYNNFGRFDVRLDVPAGWLVGATGVLQNAETVLTPTARERLARVLLSDSLQRIVTTEDLAAGRATATSADGRLVWHFVADTVSDFAWAASSRYVWEAVRAPIPGKGAIPFHMLYLPGRAASFAGASDVGRHALAFYSRLWMPYAFPQFTMVDGPQLGMEYPMFIMSDLEGVDHEAGHQWWPMMVGVNETWYGWMDEGFSGYMNRLSDADARGEPPALDGLGQSYGPLSGDEQLPPLMWNSNYAGPVKPAYLVQAYRKASWMLSMLGGIVGDSTVWRAMSGYATTWRFKHPSPWDFAFYMDRALGRDFGWFWYYWLFTNESVDGAIRQVTTHGRRTDVVVRQDGQMPSPVVLKVEFARAGPAIVPMSNSVLTDSVTAVVRYPVDVWFAGRRTFTASLDFGGRRIERITLDPGGRFPDRDPVDNVWPRVSPVPVLGPR